MILHARLVILRLRGLESGKEKGLEMSLEKMSSAWVWTSSGQYYKTFFGIIYATSGIFPYDFDRG